MPAKPTGTVTFLFTDIEGSTKLWEWLPDAMRVALARHDAIMRAAITENGGVVFKTIGDAFCAAFQHAPDALLAAVDAQRALANEEWGAVGRIKVRLALNSGEAELRDGDYFGQPLNRVARLLATGHGDQILVSTATRHLLHQRAPSDAELRDLGRHRLKDLARPERVYQAVSAGVPAEFKKLKSQPSPWPGMGVAPAFGLVGLSSFRYFTRSSNEGLADALSPVGLFGGLKGLLIELSTYNETLLLAVGLVFLAVALAIGVLRWRQARRQLRLSRKEPGRLASWAVNQRTVACFAGLALLVLVAWGYQQYLWRVALPIPDEAVGIALTREASAATVQEGLADALFAQGQAQRVVVRELPVKFDARDTAKARDVGERIGAEAVIIYRVDEASDGTKTYVAYVVFVDPSIALTVGTKPGTTTDVLSTPPQAQPVEVKQGVQVPVLRTETLSELINAAAGIIAYDGDRLREAIKYLELAVPPQPGAPNSGVVNYYLGNAYNLDGQTELATEALERAVAHYEAQQQAGAILGPQDELILLQTYLERGRIAMLQGDYDTALAWYQKGLDLREDLLARKDGLERPSDVRATYARLYTLMADVYRFQDKAEDERFWRQRATEELDALAAEAEPDDPYPLVQESGARFFAGDCVRAGEALTRALAIDPDNADAYTNAGIIALQQGRADLAVEQWQQILAMRPNDINARLLLASQLLLAGLGDRYVDPTYFEQAEAYYREIIQIDPTNLLAHRMLAELALLRAQGIQLDATALSQEDNLSLAKSQAIWPLDRQALLSTLAAAIDALRVIAAELRPGNADDAAGVAVAYGERANAYADDLYYGELLSVALAAPPVAVATPGATPATTTGAAATPIVATVLPPPIREAGEAILDDVAQVRRWTDEVFADPAAPRYAQLQAWAIRLRAIEWEWTWYFYPFLGNDPTKADLLWQEYGQAAADAVAYAEAAPIGGTDEIVQMRMIYLKASLAVGLFDPSNPLAQEYETKSQELGAREQSERAQSAGHITTFCGEERERVEGDAALAANDAAGAQERYEAALALNPQHAPSLLGLAEARAIQGDTPGAIEQATAATEADPRNPSSWAALGYFQFAAGDIEAAKTAHGHYLATLGADGPQRRMASLQEVVARLQEAVDQDPSKGMAAVSLLPAFAAFLDGMAPEGEGTHQYPALYAALGALALYADNSAEAEPLLRRAIELDPHQPAVHAHLAMAVAAQGRDPTPETVAAAAETADPIWTKAIGFDAPTVVSTMEEAADAYGERFPDRQAAVDAFKRLLGDEQTRQQQRAKGVVGTGYASPTFGYGLAWDPSWSVDDLAAGQFSDHIRLGNGDSDVLFEAAWSFGYDLASCLDQATELHAKSPDREGVAPALAPDGSPIAGAEPGRAYAAFTFADGAEPRVLHLECRALGSGASWLLIVADLPVEGYAREAEAIDGLLASLTSPSGSPMPRRLPELGPV